MLPITASLALLLAAAPVAAPGGAPPPADAIALAREQLDSTRGAIDQARLRLDAVRLIVAGEVGEK